MVAMCSSGMQACVGAGPHESANDSSKNPPKNKGIVIATTAQGIRAFPSASTHKHNTTMQALPITDLIATN